MMNIDKINELFKCKFCKEIYREPVILTCGHKICNKDINELRIDCKNLGQKLLQCHVCLEVLIEPEYGFLIDKEFSIFAELTGFKGIDFGEKYKRCQESVDIFKQGVETLKYHVNNPDYYISQYFETLKLQINIERDELIIEIDKHYSKLIGEVDQLEKICKLSKPLEVLKPQNNLKKLNKEIELFEGNLKKLTHDIELLKVNEEHWEKISFEAGYQNVKLRNITCCYTNNLLTNKSFSFEPMFPKITEFLNTMHIDENQIHDSIDWTEYGLFQFKLTDFTRFTQMKDSSFKTDTFIFKGFKWYIKLRNYDQKHLCWTLHCDLEDSTVTIVQTLNRFEIINLKDPNKHISRRLKVQFKNDAKGHGIKQFCTFKDLYNNGLYDEENNLININLYVQINDMCGKANNNFFHE